MQIRDFFLADSVFVIKLAVALNMGLSRKGVGKMYQAIVEKTEAGLVTQVWYLAVVGARIGSEQPRMAKKGLRREKGRRVRINGSDRFRRKIRAAIA